MLIKEHLLNLVEKLRLLPQVAGGGEVEKRFHHRLDVLKPWVFFLLNFSSPMFCIGHSTSPLFFSRIYNTWKPESKERDKITLLKVDRAIHPSR